MTNKDILNERERIKKIVERKITELITFRERNIKHKRRRNLGMLEKLKRDIIFLVDNPDYVRLKDRVEPTTSLLQESVGERVS